MPHSLLYYCLHRKLRVLLSFKIKKIFSELFLYTISVNTIVGFFSHREHLKFASSRLYFLIPIHTSMYYHVLFGIISGLINSCFQLSFFESTLQFSVIPTHLYWRQAYKGSLEWFLKRSPLGKINRGQAQQKTELLLKTLMKTLNKI